MYVLCAGTSSWAQDILSQTQLVWTSLPSFLHSSRTPNQMLMRVRYFYPSFTFSHTHTASHTHTGRSGLVKKHFYCVGSTLWLLGNIGSPDLIGGTQVFCWAASSCPLAPHLTWSFPEPLGSQSHPPCCLLLFNPNLFKRNAKCLHVHEECNNHNG